MTQFKYTETQLEWLNSPEIERYELQDFSKLNEASGAFRAGTVSLIVAKSGYGKSSLCVDWSIRQAISLRPTLLVSAEMPIEVLMPRYHANLFGMTIREAEKIPEKFKAASDEQKEKMLNQYETRTDSIPLKIVYQRNLEDILAQVIEAAQDHYVKHVFIDHFFEIETTMQFGSDREREIYIITEIQKVAEQYGICFVIATQFGKAGEKGLDFGKRELDDIRGASEIRNKVTTVFYLYETEEQNKSNKQFGPIDVPALATIRLLKARNGREGAEIEVSYFKARSQFFEN
jgi:replicative DNA helicase